MNIIGATIGERVKSAKKKLGKMLLDLNNHIRIKFYFFNIMTIVIRWKQIFFSTEAQFNRNVKGFFH
jgi:hypothetical protein